MTDHLQVVYEEADGLALPLQALFRLAAEGHGAVLRGAVSNLSSHKQLVMIRGGRKTASRRRTDYIFNQERLSTPVLLTDLVTFKFRILTGKKHKAI